MSAGYGGPGGGGGYGPPGGQPPGGGGAFGQPPGGAPPQGGAFGQPPAAAPQGGAFGQPAPQGGAFGQPPAGPGGGSYGPPPAQGGAFGQPPAGGGAYGPPGGAPTGGAFGQPPGGAFGPPAGGGGAFGPPAGGGGAFGGGDPNASQGSVGEMFTNFGLLAKRSLSGIAWVYILFAVLSFLIVTLPQNLINALRLQAVVTGDSLLPIGVISGLGVLTTLLAIVGGLVIGTLQSGLARAARIAMVEGLAPLGGFGGVLKASYARFFPVLGCLLLYVIGVIIGTFLCVLPGLAIAYLGMVGVYLCAAKDEGPWDALMHSGRLTTKYIGPCAVLVVVAIVVGGIMLGINVGLTALFISVLGMWGTFTTTVIVTLLAIPVGLLMWLLAMATFVTVETAESQVAISK